MEKNEKVRRFVPVNSCDLAACEGWLSHMAAKGLFIQDFGVFLAHFKKGKPKAVTYRMEPVAPHEELPSKEIHASYIQAGWEYVTCMKDTFCIYRIDSDEAEEVHTDLMSQQDAFEVLERKLRRNAILITVGAVLIAAAIMNFYFLRDEPVLYIVEYGSFISQCCYILLEVFLVAMSMIDLKYVKGYIKRLRSGEVLYHQKNYRRSLNWHVTSYILIIAVFISGMVISYKEINQSWRVTQVWAGLPVISLEELEEDEGFKYAESDRYNGKGYGNTVAFQWSVLSPVQYEVEQSGKVEGKLWADESGVYTPSLRINYYEVAFKGLAQPLMNDLISRYDVRFEDVELEQLKTDDFDSAVLAVDDNSQYLFACKEKQVICMMYFGEKMLADKIGEIGAAINKGTTKLNRKKNLSAD